MFRGKPLAGAGETGLHFVGDEENAVLAADILQQLEVVARRNDEAAFAENGFGDNRGDGFRSDGTLESVFQAMGEGFRGSSYFAPVGIGKRNTVNVAGKGLEAGFVGMRFARERHSQKRPAVEGIFETDNRGALGMGTRDLDGIFDSLGARVDQHGFFREIAGSQRIEFFRDGHVALVGSDGEA